MVILDDARKEFSKFLAEDPEARWRLDAALAHIVKWAYNRGCEDTLKQVQVKKDEQR